MIESWSALDDDKKVDDDKLSDSILLQQELDNIDKMMYDLVKDNSKAMDYLFTRFVIDSTIAAPGDDMLQIGIKQGKVELLRWIYDRAEKSQIKPKE